MGQLFLSRRNLIGLLAKLDRNVQYPGDSRCTLQKNNVPGDPYLSDPDHILVTALEDEIYYAKREPGPMVAQEESLLAKYNADKTKPRWK